MSVVAQNTGVSAEAHAIVTRPDWFDGRPRIGIHTSIAGDPCRALDIAARIGCTALQIFSGSPRMWPRPHQRAMPAEVAQRFRERRAALHLGPVAVHANYLINLASSDPRQWENSVAAFRDEIIRANQLGADYLIVHPGSAREAGIASGIENVAEAVARAAWDRFSTCPPFGISSRSDGDDGCGGSVDSVDRISPVRVLFENTAGQGTGLASEFEHLRDMLKACRARWDRLSPVPTQEGACHPSGNASSANFSPPPPGICLDTAHLLAAGFEIRTPEGLDRTLAAAGAAFGLENVCVIHCNDSKVPLGARLDRHQHIGRGHIGREAFTRILNHPLLRSPERAFLAETPIDRPGDDRRNVRALWSLLGMRPGGTDIPVCRPSRGGVTAGRVRARRAHGKPHRRPPRRARRNSSRRIGTRSPR